MAVDLFKVMTSIHIDTGLAVSQFLGSLPTFIAVILASTNSNRRVDDLRGKMKGSILDLRNELKDSIKSEASLVRAEMRRAEDVMDARLRHLEENR